MAAVPSGQTGSKRKYNRNAAPPKHVALIVEAAIAPRRLLLTGIARYIQEHEPWCVYLKPVGVEQDLAHWLQEWEGDGIIVSASDPDNSILPRAGIAVVDLFGTMRERGYPMVHADDFAVAAAGDALDPARQDARVVGRADRPMAPPR